MAARCVHSSTPPTSLFIMMAVSLQVLALVTVSHASRASQHSLLVRGRSLSLPPDEISSSLPPSLVGHDELNSYVPRRRTIGFDVGSLFAFCWKDVKKANASGACAENMKATGAVCATRMDVSAPVGRLTL